MPILKKKKSVEQELSVEQTDTLSARVKAGGDFGKWSVELFRTRTISANESGSETFDEMLSELHEKVEEYIESHGYVRADEEVPSRIEPDPVEEIDPGEEEGLTENDVLKMKKADLIELIEEEELDIDPSDYKKIADLRNAVVEIAFGDEEVEEEAEEEAEEGGEEKDEWGDFDGDEEKGEETEEEGLTEDDINAMDRKELITLIDEEELEIEYKKIKVLSKLKKAVIDIAFE